MGNQLITARVMANTTSRMTAASPRPAKASLIPAASARPAAPNAIVAAR